jgi:glycosyltransferase involved in cell wall biosynthesis
VTVKRVLHCHSTFSLGGKEARAVRLMYVFGDRAEHVVLSAVPDALDARNAIDPSVRVSFPGASAPSLAGRPGISRYRSLAAYMQQFDLVLTYNWGAMDAVAARRLFPCGSPPLVHHEDGFNADEAARLDWKRNLFRRLALPAATAVIVPSERLESIARAVWHQSAGKVRRVPNGIDVMAYRHQAQVGAIPGLPAQDGLPVIGTLAGLRPVKNLSRLVRAFARQPVPARLVIVGEGPERSVIEAEAGRLGVADRVLMPGFLPEPWRYLGLFDLFALSSDSEQFPVSVIEAMAAGLPVVATDVGDVRSMVSEENRGLIVPAPDEDALADRIGGLLADPVRRRAIGAANARKAAACFDEAAMIAAYAEIYGFGAPA